MSGVVVDLGCKPHNEDRSIEPLIDRFAPDQLLGFDPLATTARFAVGQTKVLIQQAAAWVHDGALPCWRTDDKTTVMHTSTARDDDTERPAQCFDFSSFLHGFKEPQVVVKMDIEGAEVPVLEKVIADGTDDRMSLLIVEWHDQFFDRGYVRRRKAIQAALRCPVEIWP